VVKWSAEVLRLTKKLKIALGGDHAGFPLKEKVREYLSRKGYEVEDQGPATSDPVDYPDFAEKVAARVAAKEADYGVLVCGTGIGVAIAANKIPGIRAATANDTLSAHFARAHNDANVLALGGRLADAATAEKILDTWFTTPFEGGRHQRRVDKIAEIDRTHHTEKKP
jgi:ribose 5-phosphate isomerase B